MDVQLKGLGRVLAERESPLALDDGARAWQATAGYDTGYGARARKLVIQRQLQNPLASLMLEGKIAEGEVVTVSAGDGGLLITREPVNAAAAPSTAPVADSSERRDSRRSVTISLSSRVSFGARFFSSAIR